MTLSLCMIAFNEADQIADCLQTVRGLVDEVVIVDTGSTDRTPDLAGRAGARVIESKWPEDFGAARNQSLQAARGEWILVLDPDERLFPRHFEAIRRLMRQPRAQAVQGFVRTYSDDTTLLNWQPIDLAHTEAKGFCGYFDSPDVRLFRRDRRIAFEGIVHESLVPSLERAGIPIYRADVIIHHYREARPPEKREARNRLVFEMSRRRTEREPEIPSVWRQRALAALTLGDRDDAERSIRRALELEPARRGFYLQLGNILIQAGKAGEAADFLRSALERFPEDPELVQVLGDAYLAAGRLDDAREEFARSLQLDPYIYRALIGLGMISMRENRHDAAIDYFNKAQSIRPGLDIPHLNKGLIHLERKDLEPALNELRQAFTIYPKRTRTLTAIGQILFESEKYREAADWYRRAAESDDCPAEVFAQLAACCIARGEEEQARDWARRAAEADPACADLLSRIEEAQISDKNR